MAKIPGLNLIYQPAGKALEYAPLALNLYNGCIHGCRYCYVPKIMRSAPERFHAGALARPGLRVKLEQDCKKVKELGLKGPILMCFTCDPYQPAEEDYRLTRMAIRTFNQYNINFAILTKGGLRAVQDFTLYKKGDQFAVTLTFLDILRSLEWEPKAALPQDRIAALKIAHDMRIKTWVSLEPIIDPAETLEIIRQTHEFVDLYKVGKWNHSAQANIINWSKFGRDVIDLLEKLGKSYYIKEDLRKYL